MEGGNPLALIASIVVGIGLTSAGILADALLSRRLRIGMAALGCCVILAGVMAL
jgi:hypothetical protein